MKFGLTALIVYLAAPAFAQDLVGERIKQSAEAAQRLQGPLDGTWKLVDSRGHKLLTLQIEDPAALGESISCSWRSRGRELGAAVCAESGSKFSLSFSGRHVVVRRQRTGVWRGRLLTGRDARIVLMLRG